MKESKYTKTLAKILATAIFLMRDMRRNFLLKFIEICTEKPCWCPSVWAPTWRPETNRSICHWVLQQKREFIPRGTLKHYNNTFSKTWTVQIAKFPEISHFFNYNDSSLGRHVNAASCKSLEIQALCIAKPRTHSERKFVWILVFSCSYTSFK